MSIGDRIHYIKQEFAAQPYKSVITLPVHTVKTLIRHHEQHTEFQESVKSYKAKAKWHQDAHNTAKKEIKLLRAELAALKEVAK